jgi:hypothetical protein
MEYLRLLFLIDHFNILLIYNYKVHHIELNILLYFINAILAILNLILLISEEIGSDSNLISQFLNMNDTLCCFSFNYYSIHLTNR